ncbi:MAG: hypothetical protein KA369_23710 [Spirochaetes bacterium]|nr:hypothetical protein [Spirochaetota bacterium]
MALITCIECKKEMSDTLEACPHCGYKRTTIQNVDKPNPEVKSNLEVNPNNTICSSCGKPYYKGASKCPYCKTKNVNKKTYHPMVYVILGIILVFVILKIIGFQINLGSTSKSTIDDKVDQALCDGQLNEAISILTSTPKNDPNYNESQQKLKELQMGLYLFKQNHFWVSSLGNGKRKFFDIEYANFDNYNMRINGNTVFNGTTGTPLMRYVGYINNGSIKIMDVGYEDFMMGVKGSDNGKIFDCVIGQP